MAKLTLDDIAEPRAYERQRAALREDVIAAKRVRRLALGPILTVVFENAMTVRFQVQEMARAERLLTDAQIQAELDTYNPLIPDAGQLSASLFIELVSKEELTEWLPKLVGIERAVALQLGIGPAAVTVRATAEEQHAANLTRDSVTASVHFLRFELTPGQIMAFANRPVELVVAHPSYAAATGLSEETKESLLEDLRG